MELLHARSVDGFCLVLSDCDFTGLAVRIREAGLRVYGLGMDTTTPALVSACGEFVFLDLQIRRNVLPETPLTAWQLRGGPLPTRALPSCKARHICLGQNPSS